MAYNMGGSLSKNKYRNNDSQPEYTGKATINGVLYRIAAWTKQGEDGEFFSLKFSIPQPKGELSSAPPSFPAPTPKTAAPVVASAPVLDEEDIPF